MQVTRKKVAGKIVAYLKHTISLSQLVNWAENVMMEGAVDNKYALQITKVVSKLGVADVKAFGLEWDDCQEMLRLLGCEVEINVKMVA